ncbi:BTB/POZ domain-containing protein [Thalictrum thalictroides]|uniref:BTB/POZ domain-containing protein n=1 Tax=Thalictrum thalictroides TaxID=46969 RepID=A0A7J6W6R9_THATH|nr:BTB/POZ domain-containing protein [Thalictrum thalictroides]
MSNRQPWTIDPYLDGIDLDQSDFNTSVPLKKVPNGDVFQASRAGDVERLRFLLETTTVDVNARDKWDSVALYYACLAGHLDAARMLLESGAICSEHTFDGDRCHYAALNLKVRKLLKAFEARPPPLGPLQAALRDTFLGCRANRFYSPSDSPTFQLFGHSSNDDSNSCYFPPDVTFFVQSRPIEAHRTILSARSPYFKTKFEMDWKDRKEVRFSKERLSYEALYSLIHFFYSDRLEIAVDDMEDLVRICRVCKCEGLQKLLEKELFHQTYAEYKSLRGIENSQKRFILQGLSLPEEDRLPAALYRILQASLANCKEDADNFDMVTSGVNGIQLTEQEEDLADICVKVETKIFRCHQIILASRSEYFRARLSRMKDFLEGRNEFSRYRLPILEERDLSTEAFEKMIEYMYTDELKDVDVDPDQAEELFDVASRYLLFPLKRAVGDVLLPHLDMLSPAELCQWLILSDIYGVLKIREFCLDVIACNFETFANSPEFRAMLLTLPPPSGDSSDRTTLPSAPGSGVNSDQGNILDDLREKWLQTEAGELDKRDESAIQFDKRLEILMVMAKQESDNHEDD